MVSPEFRQGYSWDQVHIGGVWFDDHGGSYNDGTLVGADVGTDEIWSDNRNGTTDAFFANLGAALNANHGEDAEIHLRQCYAGDANPDGERPLLRRAALSSGHSVTGPQGYVDYSEDQIDGHPDYFAEGGYYMATPNASGTDVTYSQYGDWYVF